MVFFCKHEWSILSETVTDCKAKALTDLGIAHAKGIIDPADRKFIQIVTCDKCGKLKRFVNNI